MTMLIKEMLAMKSKAMLTIATATVALAVLGGAAILRRISTA